MKDGRRLSLQFPYFSGSSTADEFVELIRQELRAVGIDAQTRKYSPAIFFAPYQNNGIVYGGKWDMTAFIWQDLPHANLSSIYECNQIPPNGQNALHYCNHELDRLLEKEKGTYDERKQAELLDREMRMIVADVPTIVLFILDEEYSHSRNLTDFHPGAFTSFDEMGNVALTSSRDGAH